MKKIWKWLQKVFTSLENDVDKFAISVTEHIKDNLDNGAIGFILDFVDKEFNTHIAPEVVGLLKNVIPKVLAAELAIQGLPINPTEQDILDFENKVLDAFGLHSQKDKMYTVLASQIYIEIKTLMNKTEGITFADTVKLIETAYADYLKEK